MVISPTRLAYLVGFQLVASYSTLTTCPSITQAELGVW